MQLTCRCGVGTSGGWRRLADSAALSAQAGLFLVALRYQLRQLNLQKPGNPRQHGQARLRRTPFPVAITIFLDAKRLGEIFGRIKARFFPGLSEL